MTETALRIGIVAPTSGDEVRRFEALGVDSFWVGGHLASPSPSPEPMVWLARLAEQSKRAAIGTASLVLPWYAPAVVAKQLADIDRASGGRVIVGVGGGGEYADDFAAAGVPIGERGSRLDESIDLLRRFWTGDPVDHRGRHFEFHGLRLHPPPRQPGGPPVIVTGRQAPAMRRAVRRGDGWMPYLYSPERYARSVATIREMADEADRDLGDFAWMTYVMVSLADDRRAARESAARFLGATYGQDFEAILDRTTVAGTPSEVHDRLSAFVGAGARHLILLSCSPSEPHGLERVLGEIVPELRVS